MSPEIVRIPSATFVGIHQKMSIIKNSTVDLFRAFMPRRHEVANRVDTKIIDLRVYDKDYFNSFNPKSIFTKWACVQVSRAEHLPYKMACYYIKGGLYARFSAPENPTNPSDIFQFIFSEWLPNSKYQLDNRPHFDILNDHQKNIPSSGTQQIHIPILSQKWIGDPR